MPEPINPQDHEVRGSSPEDFCVFDVGSPTQRLPERSALAEAIHQTFERDAAWLAAEDAKTVEDHNKQQITQALTAAFGGVLPNGPEDPPTEIDRMARLIVDGEYRRRAEQENQSND